MCCKASSSAIAANPTLVTLGIGINDAGQGVSLGSFAENLEAIITRLKSQTDARIVVTNIPDISTAPRIPQMLRSAIHGRIVLFNQKIDEISSQCGVTVFNIYETTHELLPVHPEFFSADGFHPSDAGYEHWAQEMWPVVDASIQQ
jgi:acyl-CoA thioesterase I